MNYNEDIMIRVRVAREMKDEFKAVATKNNTSMSDLIRGWISEYVATHNNVALTETNKIGQVVATTNITIISNDGNVETTYNKGEPIARKYQRSEYNIVATQ